MFEFFLPIVLTVAMKKIGVNESLYNYVLPERSLDTQLIVLFPCPYTFVLPSPDLFMHMGRPAREA